MIDQNKDCILFFMYITRNNFFQTAIGFGDGLAGLDHL